MARCSLCFNLKKKDEDDPRLAAEFTAEQLLYAQKTNSCDICRYIADGIHQFEDHSWSLKKDVSRIYLYALSNRGDSLTIELYFRNDKPKLVLEFYHASTQHSQWDAIRKRSAVKGFPALTNGVEWVKSMLYECLTKHTPCKIAHEPLLPKRTLLLTQSSTGEPSVKLCEHTQERGRYLSLSHCWGSSPACVTTAKNIEANKQGIPWMSLPTTFQDAINFALALDVHHLWVDSLCIIQQNPRDWQVESSRMAEIYQNAYLTLAATASNNGSEGCFSLKRRPGKEFHLQHRVNEDGIVVREKVKHWPMRSTKASMQAFPLFTRGWVLQERYLSPRTLHFCAQEMAWECLEEITCECGGILADCDPLERLHLIPEETKAVAAAQQVKANSEDELTWEQVAKDTNVPDEPPPSYDAVMYNNDAIRLVISAPDGSFSALNERHDQMNMPRHPFDVPASVTTASEDGVDTVALTADSSIVVQELEQHLKVINHPQGDAVSDEDTTLAPGKHHRRSRSWIHAKNKFIASFERSSKMDFDADREMRRVRSLRDRFKRKVKAASTDDLQQMDEALAIDLPVVSPASQPITPTSEGEEQIKAKIAGLEHVSDQWHDIVEQYTALDLSEEIDRLPALSGLAVRASAVLGTYYCGLWLIAMEHDLLWRVALLEHKHGRPAEYTGPSWSWASVTGPVAYWRDLDEQYDDNAEIERLRRDMFTLETWLERREAKQALQRRLQERAARRAKPQDLKAACEVELAGENLFGEVSSAYLRVSGKTCNAMLQYVSQYGSAASTHVDTHDPFRYRLTINAKATGMEGPRHVVLELPFFADYVLSNSSNLVPSGSEIVLFQVRQNVCLVLKEINHVHFQRIGIVRQSSGYLTMYGLDWMSGGTYREIIIV